MDQYDICYNYYQIISGTDKFLSPAYKEAVEHSEPTSQTGLKYLRNFLTSIETLSSKDSVKDNRISKSRGNVKQFTGYKDIKTVSEFLHKNLSGVPLVNDCTKVLDALEAYTPYYTRAYDKNCRLLVLEYENAVYLLVNTLSMIMANNMEVVANGTELRVQKRNAKTFGVTDKTMKELAKQLSDHNHKTYLEKMLDGIDDMIKSDTTVNESTTFVEGVVGDTLDFIDAIFKFGGKVLKGAKYVAGVLKNSLFGIIPLIRSIIYLRYKKKADSVANLEQQATFIMQNIERLEKEKTMDPAKKAEIIKRQKATAEAYMKKAEKIRAELAEGEKDAATEISKEDPKMKDTDDDFVLESGVTVSDAFGDNSVNFNESRTRWSHKSAGVRREFRRDIKFVTHGKTHGIKPIKDWEMPKDGERIIRDCVKEVEEESELPSIRLKPGKRYAEDNDPKKRTTTKFGGVPYWPADKKYPQVDGKDMYLLAQLNFSELPKLPDYPTSGILQFFIADMDFYRKPNHTKVVYHSSISTEMRDIPLVSTTIGKNLYEDDLPLDGVYFPEATISTSIINVTCNDTSDLSRNFWSLLAEKLNVKFGTSWDYWKFPSKVNDIIYNTMDHHDTMANTKIYGSRVNGHPYFIQEDCRNRDDEVMIFQMDSESSIMWGDCGLCYFFMSRNDLKKRNFNNVHSDWHCY